MILGPGGVRVRVRVRVREGVIADGDGVWHGDAGERAVGEGVHVDGGEAGREGDAGEGGAAVEGEAAGWR